jgi:hypothetical protein
MLGAEDCDKLDTKRAYEDIDRAATDRVAASLISYEANPQAGKWEEIVGSEYIDTWKNPEPFCGI